MQIQKYKIHDTSQPAKCPNLAEFLHCRCLRWETLSFQAFSKDRTGNSLATKPAFLLHHPVCVSSSIKVRYSEPSARPRMKVTTGGATSHKFSHGREVLAWCFRQCSPYALSMRKILRVNLSYIKRPNRQESNIGYKEQLETTFFLLTGLAQYQRDNL